MIQDFSSALAFVLLAEGGFSQDAADRGGVTNYGITQGTYSAWLRNHNMPDAPVSAITREYVGAIYQEVFWTAGGCDKLPSPLNLVHFDSVVQHGPSRSTLMLSSAIAFAGAAVESEAFALLALRHNLYQRIVRADPTQSKFLDGWMNRLNRLRTAAGL